VSHSSPAAASVSAKHIGRENRTVKLAKKKAAVASGPKFREETPKKGNNTATPIAVLQRTT
jgi:hypothetical protein